MGPTPSPWRCAIGSLTVASRSRPAIKSPHAASPCPPQHPQFPPDHTVPPRTGEHSPRAQEVRVPDLSSLFFFEKLILRAVKSAAVLLDLVACCVFVVREMRERCEFSPLFCSSDSDFFFRVVL